MKTSNHWREVAAQLCAQMRAEDGIDPRLEKGGRKPKASRIRDGRICRETERVLPLILASATANPLLHELRIVSVDLEDNGRRLRVVLAKTGEALSEQAVVQALAHAQSWLRTELARHFHRKRMPVLLLDYVGDIVGEGWLCR